MKGAGFPAGALVTLRIVHNDNTAEEGGGHDPWTVVADEKGAFEEAWYVNPDDSRGAVFLFTADAEPAYHAQMLFTDASQTVVLNLSSSGWYDSTGFHNAANSNYVAGLESNNRWRNFFVYSLAGVSGTVTAATLQAFNPGARGPSQTYSLFDVTTPITALIATNSGRADIFNDLGSGTAYGSSFIVNPFATNISVPLNPAGIAAIQARLGGTIAFGGDYPPSTNPNFIFGFSGGNGSAAVQLILQVQETSATQISQVSGSGTYAGTAALQATLTTSGSPLAGKTLSFTVNGSFVGTAATNGLGVATLSNVPLNGLTAGNYSVAASFAGDANYLASGASGTLTINRAATTISVAGGTFAYDGNPHAAAGAVAGVNGVNLGTPTFSYTDSDNVTTSTAPVSPGTYIINASFAGNTNYLPGSNSSIQLVITKAGTATSLAVLSSAWQNRSPMPTARNSIPAGVIDGLIYVAGGWNGFHRTTVEAYNAGTNDWTPKPDRPYPGQTRGVTGVIGGTLYVAGGTDCCVEINATYAFTPPGTWVAKAPMPTTRQAAAGGALNGKLYVAGGINTAGAGTHTTFDTLEEFDPAVGSGTWATKAPMPTARSGAAGAAVGGRFYVVGGTTADGTVLRAVEAYDPGSNTWETKAPMPTARHALALAEAGGVLYAIGGYDGSYLATVEAYDPVTNTWSTQPSLLTARSHLAALVVNDTIYAIGGASAASGALAANEAYVPSPSALSTTPGQTLTLTATLNTAASTTERPAGTVTFRNGSTVLGTATLNGSGVATLAISTLTTGSYSFTAEYGGSDRFTASTSPSIDHTVDKADTTTTVSSAPNGSQYGQSVTFTATVLTGGAAVGDGSVTFKEGARVLAGPVALDASGKANFNTAPLTTGNHTITAEYSGNDNNKPSSASVLHTVNKADTNTFVTSALNPSTFGQSTTFTATVKGFGAPATDGTVTFKDGTTVLAGPVPVDAEGRAVWATSTLPAGTHAITAEYSGSDNFTGSTRSMDQTVLRASATIVVTGYSGVYDGNAHGAAGTATGVNGEDLAGLLDLGARFTSVPGGTAYWVFAGDANYAPGNGTASIDISQATASITVNRYSGVYNGAAHGATGSATGVNGENLSHLLNLGERFTNVPGGIAHWTFAGDTNYAPGNGTASIDISQATASITVNRYSGVYNGAAHGATGSATGVNGEDLSQLLNLGERFTNVPGGTAHWTFAGDTNYAPGNGTASIDISQATASITVNGYSGVYNGAAHRATGSATGVNGEDLSSLLNLGASFTNVPGGTARWTFAGNTNYAAAAGETVIAITQASLMITANDSTKLLGAANPPLTASYAGFVNGETPASLDTPVILSTTASSASPVGTYSITAGGATDVNYSIQFVPGTLKVNYNLCPLYDPTKIRQSGSTIPIKVQLCDVSGSNVSSPSIALHATSVYLVSTMTAGVLEDAGESNPDDNFRLVGPPTLYMFNLQTKGFVTGTYELAFIAGQDSTPYALRFQIR